MFTGSKTLQTEICLIMHHYESMVRKCQCQCTCLIIKKIAKLSIMNSAEGDLVTWRNEKSTYSFILVTQSFIKTTYYLKRVKMVVRVVKQDLVTIILKDWKSTYSNMPLTFHISQVLFKQHILRELRCLVVEWLTRMTAWCKVAGWSQSRACFQRHYLWLELFHVKYKHSPDWQTKQSVGATIKGCLVYQYIILKWLQFNGDPHQNQHCYII